MSIPLFLNKIKGRVGEHRKTLIFIGVLAGTAAGAFYIGYTAAQESQKAPPVSIMCPAAAYMDALALSGEKTPSSGGSVAASGSGAYVASKSGTKYYPVACSSAKKIKDENKVFFSTEVAARAAGLALAAGCK